MSRTDKDRPSWVRVNDPLEKRVPYHHHVDLDGKDIECDIDVPFSEDNNFGRIWDYEKCGFYLYTDSGVDMHPERHRCRPWCKRCLSQKVRPVRNRNRDDMLGLVREYNTFGAVEDDYVGVEDFRNVKFEMFW